MSGILRGRGGLTAGLLILAAAAGSGCATLDGIPVNRVPLELLAKPRDVMQETSLTRLRQDAPPTYLLGPGDTLGIFIETVLGAEGQDVPVFSTGSDDRAPALGYPVIVGDEGEIEIPYVSPIDVSGLTVKQVTEKIRNAYTVDQQILPKGKDRILVSLIRKRTYRVLVVREDQAAGANVFRQQKVFLGETDQGEGFELELPAYENDVLSALSRTGGLPSEEARNEVVIYRGMFNDAQERDRMMAEIAAGADVCSIKPEAPPDKNVVRIPLRYDPNNPPEFTQNDILLHDGDILVIEARETDVFYTGGVLPGQQLPLPRDYDIDVVDAIALAGGSVGGPGTGIGNLGRGGQFNSIRSQGSIGVPPTLCYVMRKTPTGEVLPIRINLKKAMIDVDHRVIVQPGDMILVQYTFSEELANAVLGVLSINYAGNFTQFKEF